MNDTGKKTTLDVVIPIYNEAECIPELMRRLLAFRQSMGGDVRYLFVDDGSKDESVAMLTRFVKENDFIRLIVLSRNFGHQLAVTAGLDHADADYVAIIDADLQDPPELIGPMLAKAATGFDIVYGKREERKGDSIFKKVTAALFYKLLTQICDVDIPRDTGDFRLISRRVLKFIQEMREPHRFLRGMIPWIGFKSDAFPYKRDSRYGGITKYPFRRMLKLAVDAIFSFSMAPIRMATYIGLTSVGFGVTGALVLVYLRFFTNYTVPGITAVLIMVILLGGFQIIMLGVIGEYVGRTFEASKKRPLYVIDQVIS